MSVFINNATNDLHCRLNSLLADFSHCDSVTLSTLFKTYCMNLYGSQILVHFIHVAERLYADYITFLIGYEPVGLTMHPPPKRSRVGSFFSHRCLVLPKNFPKRKSGFCSRY